MNHIHHGFLSGVTFKMDGEKLRDLALKKMNGLTSMIGVREGRIAKYREEHKITNEDLIELLRQQNNANQRGASIASYSLTNAKVASGETAAVRMIPAGVVAALEAENSNIDDEKKAIERLRLITSNMSTTESFSVSLQDLEFLGL